MILGQRIPRSPPEADGVSERTTIKCVNSLHFEDSLSTAGGLQGASMFLILVLERQI
jgi:hypothetical protein